MPRPLTDETANKVYDILVATIDATERGREYFVHAQTTEHLTEFRLSSPLGFGGKFWRNPGTLPDGTYGERWYVNTYPEDQTPARDAMIAAANTALDTLREDTQP